MRKMLKMLFRTKPIEKIIMISDNVWISCTPKGDYELSGVPVHNEGDKLVVANSAAYSLAGSCLSLNVGLKNVLRFTGLPLEKVLLCLTENPARYIGADDRKGFLRARYDADLNLLDAECGIAATWVRGRKVQ